MLTGKHIMSILSKSKFNGTIRSIRTSKAKLAELVHVALVTAAYHAHSRHGNAEPFNQVLDAVGDALHVSAISKWAEQFGCVRIEKGRFVLNKAKHKTDRIEDEDQFAERAAELLAGERWDSLNEGQAARTPSIFAPDAAIDRLVAKLTSKGEAGLAEAIAKAALSYRAENGTTANDAPATPEALAALVPPSKKRRAANAAVTH